MEDRTLTGQLRRLIWHEMRFHMRYIGEVVDDQDPKKKGRVRVTLKDIGWDSPDKAQWCWPRQIHAMDVPKVGEWVEVYFINGDRTRAAYIGLASEITDQIPKDYSDPKKRVLFQDPDNGDSVIYDIENKKLAATIGGDAKISAENIELNGNSKQFVTWEALNTALSTLAATLTAHVHPSNGAPSPGLIGLAIDISDAKTTTIKTGG